MDIKSTTLKLTHIYWWFLAHNLTMNKFSVFLRIDNILNKDKNHYYMTCYHLQGLFIKIVWKLPNRFTWNLQRYCISLFSSILTQQNLKLNSIFKNFQLFWSKFKALPQILVQPMCTCISVDPVSLHDWPSFRVSLLKVTKVNTAIPASSSWHCSLIVYGSTN